MAGFCPCARFQGCVLCMLAHWHGLLAQSGAIINELVSQLKMSAVTKIYCSFQTAASEKKCRILFN